MYKRQLVELAGRAKNAPTQLTRTEWLVASTSAKKILEDFVGAEQAEAVWATNVQESAEGE